MNKNKETIAIYGIRDNNNQPYPSFIHDHSMVLFNSGKIINFLQLERFSGIKNDNKIHFYLHKLLKASDFQCGSDFDVIFVDHILGRSFINETGNIRFEAPLSPVLQCFPEKGKAWWLGQEKEAYVLNHELAHIYSCMPFFGVFKEGSLLVHFDGGASLSNFSAWLWKDNQPMLIEYHWDFEWLSSLFNANALLFAIAGCSVKDQNAVPGKLMGLAAYGNYNPPIEEWLTKNHFFKDIWKSKQPFYNSIRDEWNISVSAIDTRSKFLQDIVATVQHIFEREFLKKMTQLAEKYKPDNLYYSGGAALNIILNAKLIHSGLFKEVFIPPCCNDTGLAIGAGACMEFLKHGKIEQHSPYLNDLGIADNRVDFEISAIEEIARVIMENQVVAVINGKGEVGPRALGNRSLLCLANAKELAEKVSIYHKGREWYRPVAPVMLEENARYFTGCTHVDKLSRYMLLEYNILPEKRHELAGACHVNGTARLQTISSRNENPFLFDLLMHLQKYYKVRALINTSFNSKGKPIVHTVEQAMEQAREMKITYIVINGKLHKL